MSVLDAQKKKCKNKSNDALFATDIYWTVKSNIVMDVKGNWETKLKTKTLVKRMLAYLSVHNVRD